LVFGRRREGYEFMIGPPKVINREVNGKKLEPFEVKSLGHPAYLATAWEHKFSANHFVKFLFFSFMAPMSTSVSPISVILL